MEQKRVQNFTLHVFKRDWEVAPHLFIKVGMAQDIYSQFVSVPHISAGYVPPTNNNAAVANNSSTAENNENDQNVANDATGTSDNITS